VSIHAEILTLFRARFSVSDSKEKEKSEAKQSRLQHLASGVTMESISQALFEAVSERDYESLARMYGTNARDAILSYLSMKQRWGGKSRGGA
jgi:hypothetical protein